MVCIGLIYAVKLGIFESVHTQKALGTFRSTMYLTKYIKKLHAANTETAIISKKNFRILLHKSINVS